MKNYIAELNLFKGDGIIPNFSEMSRQYHIDRRTLKKYYDLGYVPKRKKRVYVSEFDSYITIITNKVSNPMNTLKGIYEFLLDKYNIKTTYNNFKAYCRRHHLTIKKSMKIPHVRYETAEAEQIQVDWKEDLKLTNRNGEIFEFNIYSATLGYSRKHIFIYTKNKTESDFIRCTIETFRKLGGMTKVLKTDNMSAIVNISKGKRCKHPRILQFEKDLGIKISLCKVRTPQTKGKDESANRFVNRLMAYDNDFDDLNDLLRIIENLNQRCNDEINQTTMIPPNILFQKEKEYLLPLKNEKLLDSYLDNFVIAKVPPTLLVNFNGNGYSVPQDYIDSNVKLVQESNNLYIYSNTKLIAMHVISKSKINYSTDHYINALKSVINSDNTDYEQLALTNLERFK
jgi:transposase